MNIPTTTNPPETNERKTIEARWGAQVAAQGFTAIPNMLFRHWRDLGLTRDEVFLISMLFFYWRRPDEWPWPSLGRLAKDTGTGSRSTLQRRIEILERKGLLRAVNRGERQPNAYDLNPLLQRLTSVQAQRTASKPPKRLRDKGESGRVAIVSVQGVYAGGWRASSQTQSQSGIPPCVQVYARRKRRRDGP